MVHFCQDPPFFDHILTFAPSLLAVPSIFEDVPRSLFGCDTIDHTLAEWLKTNDGSTLRTGEELLLVPDLVVLCAPHGVVTALVREKQHSAALVLVKSLRENLYDVPAHKYQ